MDATNEAGPYYCYFKHSIALFLLGNSLSSIVKTVTNEASFSGRIRG
jgi:hypothetical protein